jgi:hypothetical protein
MCQILHESQKALDFMITMRSLPLLYTSHLVTVCVKAMLVNHMTNRPSNCLGVVLQVLAASTSAGDDEWMRGMRQQRYGEGR